jgi:hypothetical protein
MAPHLVNDESAACRKAVAAALAALLDNMEPGTRDTAVRKAGLEKTRV